MRSFLGLLAFALAAIVPQAAKGQVRVAFDPCRPADGSAPLGAFVPLCPEALGGFGGVVVRGASAETHGELASLLALDSPLSYTGDQIQRLIRTLDGSGLYDDISIEQSFTLIEVTLREKPRVARIEVQGNTALSTDSALALFDLPRGSVLNNDQIVDASLNLLGEYQALGYLGATVEPLVQAAPSFAYPSGIVLTLDIREGGLTPISSVQFSGNTALDDSALLALVSADEWKTVDQIDPLQLRADQDAILQAYAQTNFSRTSVGVRTLTLDEGGREVSPESTPASLALIFDISEEGITIGSITVRRAVESLPIAKAAALRSIEDSGLVPIGGIFDPERATQAAEQAVSAVNQANPGRTLLIAPRFLTDPETGEIHITFEVFDLPGRELVSLRIVGNDQTAEGFIRRKLGLSLGDYILSEDVQAAINSLGQTGLFQDISVTEDEAAENEAALVLTVIEEKTGTQRVGASYSNISGFSIRLGISERNWLGRGLNASLNTTIGQDSQSITGSFSPLPIMLGQDTNLTNQASVTFTNDEANTTRDTTLSYTISVNGQLAPRITETQSLTYRSSYINEAGEEASDSDKEDVGVFKNQFNLSYGLSRRTGPPPGGPNINTTNSLNLTMSFPVEDDPTARLAYRSNNVRILGENERTEASFRAAFDAVAMVNGGEYTASRLTSTSVPVRGFASGGFGPRRADDDSLYGGTYAGAASASLNYKILDNDRLPIFGSLYIDAGIITNELENFTLDDNGTEVTVLDSGLIRLAHGFGAVLQTDAGAITFTLSEIEQAEDYDEVEELQFSFGANL